MPGGGVVAVSWRWRWWLAGAGVANSIVVLGAIPVAASPVDASGPPSFRAESGRVLSDARGGQRVFAAGPSLTGSVEPSGGTPSPTTGLTATSVTEAMSPGSSTPGGATVSEALTMAPSTGAGITSADRASASTDPGSSAPGSDLPRSDEPGSIVVRAALAASSTESTTVVYPNCAAVWAAIGRPLNRGEPGYAPYLDADGDGVACEDNPNDPKGTITSASGIVTATSDPTSGQAAAVADPPPPATDPDALASTGFPALRLAGVGFALVAAGVSIVSALRSRRFRLARRVRRP